MTEIMLLKYWCYSRKPLNNNKNPFFSTKVYWNFIQPSTLMSPYKCALPFWRLPTFHKFLGFSPVSSNSEALHYWSFIHRYTTECCQPFLTWIYFHSSLNITFASTVAEMVYYTQGAFQVHWASCSTDLMCSHQLKVDNLGNVAVCFWKKTLVLYLFYSDNFIRWIQWTI